MGACVIVATDGDPAAAHRHAVGLASWVWERRADWIAPSVSVPDAIAEGQALGEFPVILADQGDNTGGGAPDDATHVLRYFLGHGFSAALVLYIVDADTAAAAARAIVGARAALAVGGKLHERLGPPVAMEAEVLAVSDGAFTCVWVGGSRPHSDSSTMLSTSVC
jgi:microcystin degradation protein MlrC